jgi:hypothetical protein
MPLTTQVSAGLTRLTTAIKEKRDKTVSINSQTASYTLVLADAAKQVKVTNAGAVNLTVPPNSSVAFPIGTTVMVLQAGAGQVTIAPGAGVTVRSAAGLKIAAQWGVAEVMKIATDEWVAYGRLTT